MGKDGNWLKSEEYFLSLADTEAMLSVSEKYSTFSLYEQLHAGALRVLDKQRMMIKLRNEKALLIDISNSTKSHELPIIDKDS